MRYLRSAVVVDPVDLASDEDADLAVLPPLLVGQQVGDQQGQTWGYHSNEGVYMSMDILLLGILEYFVFELAYVKAMSSLR